MLMVWNDLGLDLVLCVCNLVGDNMADGERMRWREERREQEKEEGRVVYAFPAACKRKYNWSVKAIRRKTTRIGRMRYLRHVPHRCKSSFREGTEATPRKREDVATA
ncbi:60S ribosomal protein L37 [Spatholobus suberectus]|nr:60S ribosomal protein L37 [Spatholobus suberectus]